MFVLFFLPFHFFESFYFINMFESNIFHMFRLACRFVFFLIKLQYHLQNSDALILSYFRYSINKSFVSCSVFLIIPSIYVVNIKRFKPQPCLIPSFVLNISDQMLSLKIARKYFFHFSGFHHIGSIILIHIYGYFNGYGFEILYYFTRNLNAEKVLQ